MPIVEPRVSFHEGYHSSLAKLDPTDAHRVNDALLLFLRDPNHPSLNLHPVEGAAKGFMSLRASQELRVIVYQRGNTFVWLFADHHDAAYQRAVRMRLVIEPDQGLTIIGMSGTGGEPACGTSLAREDPSTPDAPPDRRLLDHWTDAELEQAGFGEEERSQLRDLAVPDDALALIGVWDEDRVARVLEMIELTPELFFAPALTGADEDKGAETRLQDAITRFGALAGLSPLFDEEELERIAAAPIEEWMLFLHPDQRSLVQREFAGPARVRGAAGTGKTVVALHRAAALCKRYPGEEDRILVTTFIKSLPPVLERLFGRLPNGDPDRVEFINVDKLAYRICQEAGQRPRLDVRAIDAAFAAAFRSTVTAGSPLERAGLTRDYLKEEIRAVIKGRGVAQLDTYLELRRTGRRTQFGAAMRAQTWELKEAWDAEMAKRDTVDFHDVVLRARDLARQRTSPTYRAVIVDEAQDLTLAALQMLRALANGGGPDRPDGLFIVGDGAQRIYPGGFTLRQAGVEVRGRTAVLSVNYRNSREIYRAAVAVAGADLIEDLDEEYQRGEEPALVNRSGAPVELLAAADPDEEIKMIFRRIETLMECDAPVGPGDIGICCATNQRANEVRRAVDRAGFAAQDLAHYDGTPNDMIKVGTHHRAKGLEFKVVVLPGLTEGKFPRPPAPGMSEGEYADQLALQMSALFVAMTRARDLLILTCHGDPSPVLEPIIGEVVCHSP